MTQIPAILRTSLKAYRSDIWFEDLEGNTIECQGWGPVVRADVDGGGLSEPFFEDGVKCFMVRGDKQVEITDVLDPAWIETVQMNRLAR